MGSAARLLRERGIGSSFFAGTLQEGVVRSIVQPAHVHLGLTQADFRRYGEEGRCVAVRALTTTGPLGYAIGNEEMRPPRL
jgi:hypothetical protein